MSFQLTLNNCELNPPNVKLCFITLLYFIIKALEIANYLNTWLAVKTFLSILVSGRVLSMTLLKCHGLCHQPLPVSSPCHSSRCLYFPLSYRLKSCPEISADVNSRYGRKSWAQNIVSFLSNTILLITHTPYGFCYALSFTELANTQS